MKNKLSVTFSLLCFAIATNAQWTPLNSTCLNMIQGVNFPVSGTGYYSTNIGIIEKTTDGGATWYQVGPNNCSPRTYFLTATTGFGFWDDQLRRTTNGGVTWTRMIFDSLQIVTSVEFATPLIGYAIAINPTYDSVLTYKTLNGGSTWSLQSKFLNSLYGLYFETSFTSATTGYLASDDGKIFKTTNGGLTWIFQYDTTWAWGSIHFPAVDTGYVAGSGLYKTVNGGATWTQITVPFPTVVNSIHFLNTNVGFVCGGDGFSLGFIYKTINGGQTWTVSNGNPNTFYQLCFVNSNEGYAGGLNGVLMKYNGVTGENENENESKLNIFPNPSNGKFEISATAQISKVDIYSSLGEIVYSSENKIDMTAIDFSDKPQGIYFVKAISKNGSQITKRIIIN